MYTTMNMKTVLLTLGLVVFAGASFFLIRDMGDQASAPAAITASDPIPSAVVPEPVPSVNVPPSPNPDAALAAPLVKEFAMDSWMEVVDGKMSAHFSLGEIVVKKGDTVKVAITNTKGTHDFVIDAYGVTVDTPEGETTIVEFVADKVGTFEYYCSKYNHRSIGQTGTLRVTE